MTWNLVKLSDDHVNKVIKLHITHKCYLQIKKISAENILDSQREVWSEWGKKVLQFSEKENIFKLLNFI